MGYPVLILKPKSIINVRLDLVRIASTVLARVYARCHRELNSRVTTTLTNLDSGTPVYKSSQLLLKFLLFGVIWMSDSPRSWVNVKGWLDEKSSRLSKRLVPRRGSNRNSSNLEEKIAPIPSIEGQQSRDNPYNARGSQPSTAPTSRTSERRMSRTYAAGYSKSSNIEDGSRYSRDRPPSTVPATIKGHPLPRISKRSSYQYSSEKGSAPTRSDDVDHRVSRRRSNTSELQDRKVVSSRGEIRSSTIYPEDVRMRPRGIEPTRMQALDRDSLPASRGRPIAGSAGDSVGVPLIDPHINVDMAGDADVENHLGPPRSSMSRRSSLIPESLSQSRTIGKLVKRRNSNAIDPDIVANQMRQLKLNEDAAKHYSSRGRSDSNRDRPRSRREEEEAAIRGEERRGRSLSRGSRFSSRSRSVERRYRESDRNARHPTERRSSMTMQSSRPRVEAVPVVSESEAASNVGTVGRRPLSRTPSQTSTHQQRRLSRTPSRDDRHREPPAPSHTRRSSNASDHAPRGPPAYPPGSRSGGERRSSNASEHAPIYPPGSRSTVGRPASSGGRSAIENRPAASHSSSRYATDPENRYAQAESEARSRRRNSDASIMEHKRVSTMDPHYSHSLQKRGILRRTGRSSTFTDGMPPIAPPTVTLKELKDSELTQDPSRSRPRSRSRSRGRDGPSDDELRNNTIHNARNLKYQPERDGHTSTSPSGRHRPSLVPLRYPPGSNSNGVDGHRPLRRYTSPSVGTIPYMPMPSYPMEYQAAAPVPIPVAAGGGHAAVGGGGGGGGGGSWHYGWDGHPASPQREYYSDPYGYPVHAGQIPASHMQYPSWPPDVRGSYSQRRSNSSSYMQPSGRI